MPAISRAAVGWQRGTAKRKPTVHSRATFFPCLPATMPLSALDIPKRALKSRTGNASHSQADRPQHCQQQALPKTALLVLATRRRVSRHSYPRHLDDATAGPLPGGALGPGIPHSTDVCSPTASWLALYTAASTP